MAIKGKVNQIKKRDTGLGIPVDLSSPSVVDRFKDDSSTARKVEEQREKKEVQERNLQRKEAQYKRAKGISAKLLSSTSVTETKSKDQ